MAEDVTWYELAVELHDRAAKYSLRMEGIGGAGVVDPQPSTLFSWSYLQQLCDTPKPEPGQWWWIFAPWLKAILNGGDSSIAYLVCLGYHVGIGEGEIRSSWLHFVPEDVSKNAQRRHLIACYVGHMIRNSKWDSQLLRTTQLLERIDLAQYLRPLLISFDDTSDGAFVDWLYSNYKESTLRAPLYCLNWTPLRSILPVSEYANPINIGCFHKDISAVCGPDGDNWEPINLTISDGTTADPAKTFGLIFNVGGRLSTVDFNHLGPSQTPCALSHVVTLDNNARSYICNFVAWTHRLAPPADWSHLLTIPLWLPPNTAGARDGTVILYLRPSVLIKSPKIDETDWCQRSLADLLGCVTAAFSGSGFMPYDRIRGTMADEHDLLQQATRLCEPLFSTRGNVAGCLLRVRDSWCVCMKKGLDQPKATFIQNVNQNGWKYLLTLILNHPGEEFTSDKLAEIVGQASKAPKGSVLSYEMVDELLAKGELNIDTKSNDHATFFL